MNNTAYVPPGSLSVFSNNVSNAPTVTPLQEAIMSRMRPFGLTVSQHRSCLFFCEFGSDTNLNFLQASDLKDLPPSPFLPGGLGLVRPEGFPNFQVLSEDEIRRQACNEKLQKSQPLTQPPTQPCRHANTCKLFRYIWAVHTSCNPPHYHCW